MLGVDWLFRSISSIIVTLHKSQLGSFDWTKGIAHFPWACFILPNEGPIVHKKIKINDAQRYSELAIILILIITCFPFLYGHLDPLLVDDGLESQLPLFSSNVTLKSCTAVVHGVCLIHARIQAIA